MRPSYYARSRAAMSLPPHLPDRKTGDKEYVAIRCLIANIHKPKNVSMPPSMQLEPSPPLEVVQELSHSDTEQSERNESEKSEENLDDNLTPQKRAKSNSLSGSMILLPPAPVHNSKRRRSFLPLHIGNGPDHLGPMSAGSQFNVPKFTVTAPPGEQRRFSHGFAGAFHGFALRRHSNTVCPMTIASVEML